MFFLLGGNDKKAQKQKESSADVMTERVRTLFLNGKLPVVTTPTIEGKDIAKVLGLVCCRGYDSEEAFFGMASRAVAKGAHAIIGYMENVAFHPDGSKYFSCFGTAVMFHYEAEERYGAAAFMQSSARASVAKSLEEDSQDTVTLSAPSAGATRVVSNTISNDDKAAERRELLSQTRLGLDPEDVPPRVRKVQAASEEHEKIDTAPYVNPKDLQNAKDEPIRKFRTQ